jgi:hypothetical protein
MEVKTREYGPFALEHDVRDALRCFGDLDRAPAVPEGYVGDWYAPRAAAELLAFRAVIPGREHADVLRVVLARAARSARLTTHFDLDFPRAPVHDEYWCHKHRRRCRPVERADHFLRRYAADTVERIRAFARVRAAGRGASVLHGDARNLELGGPFDLVVTSPPYPGLIDYHEQHRYAYELLGLEDRRVEEVGAAALGTSRAALDAYVDGIAAVLANARQALRPGAPLLVVVHDRRDLFGEVLARAGLVLEERLRRHVNRRTGRRSGEFFEDVLVARAA